MQFYIIQFVAVERTLNIITSTAHKLNFRVCAHFTKCHEVALFLMTFCIFTVNLIEEFPSCHAGLPNVPCGTVALWWVMNQAEKCFHLLWGLKDICNLWPSQAQRNINNFTKKKGLIWFSTGQLEMILLVFAAAPGDCCIPGGPTWTQLWALLIMSYLTSPVF